MDKYKINYIYNDKVDINDIIIKVLKKELENYIKNVCENKESVQHLFYQEGDKNIG